MLAGVPTAGFDVNVRMLAMNKVIAITFSASETFS